MHNPFDFTGQHVAVTGAGSGIGKAAARLFAEQGARVSLLDNSAERLDAMRAWADSKQIPADRFATMTCDVADAAAVEQTFDLAAQRLGAFDFLVNNAGIEINDAGNLCTMSFDKLDRILRVNLYGYIHCARAFHGRHAAQGAIVNVSSIQGLGAHRPGTSYQISKSGIMGLTHALAIELAPAIRVNTVAPGAIHTEGIGAGRHGDDHLIDRYRAIIPLGRRGRAEEVAWCILYLCSPAASYITGSTLIVDGGYWSSLTPQDPALPVPRQPGDPDE